MFNPSREEVRQFFTETWRKKRTGAIMTPLETIAADWMVEHPEYHDDFTAQATGEAGQEPVDYPPEAGKTNPFLHLSMHLAITEQLSIDQPPGIRRAHERLAGRLGSTHEAQHAIMECLGQMLWDAQRNRREPNTEAYVACVERAGQG
jgi:hypothetical protein